MPPAKSLTDIDANEQHVKYDTFENESGIESISTSVPDSVRKAENSQKEKIVAAVLFVLANLIYIITDRRCPFNNATACASNFMIPHLAQWAIQIFCCSILFTIIITKGIKRTISRFFAIGAIVNIIYLSLFFNPVLNTYNYGQMFGFFLILSMLICLTSVGSAAFIAWCWKKNKWILIGLFVLSIIPCFILYFARIRNSCVNWTRGLGNEEIINDGETCTVKTPKTCMYEITDGFLDLSRFQSCSSSMGSLPIIERYFSGSPVIGFPRTEKFIYEERMDLQQAILNQTVSLNSLNDPAGKDLEILLDLTDKSHPSIKMDIKRNQKLVDQRSKITSNSLTKNVLVVYIDALSRAHSMRKLKKTMAWFDQFMNQQDPNAETFQFFKYHSLAPYTYSNLFESMFGKHSDDKSLSKRHPLKSFIEDYKKEGYITGHSTDFCQVTPLDLMAERDILDIPYDHEALSMACDPNYHDTESPYGILNGPYASMRRCLYGNDVFSYVYEYGDKFWRTYKDEKKLLYLDFLDAHEGTGEVIKYMDNALFNFLNNLQNDDLLKDTAVVLYADHGLHMQGLFYLAKIKQVFQEMFLPALYTVLPTEVSQKYRHDIKANQQSIVSAHQVHNFFLTLAQGENSQASPDSLIGPLRKHRTCSDIKQQSGECHCRFDQKHPF